MRHSSREPIYELAEKLTVIAEALYTQEKVKHVSRAAIARFCDLKQKSLTSACSAGKLSLEMQERMASFVGFDLENPSWIDRSIPIGKRHLPGVNANRTDTASSFRNYLLPHLGLSSVARYQIAGEIPQSKQPELASVALTDFGQHASAGSTVHGHLEASLSPGFLSDGIAYGFNTFRVRLGLSRDGGLRVRRRLAEGEVVTIGGVEVVSRGTQYEPYWEFKSPDGIFHGEIITDDDPLVELTVADVPAKLRIEMSVHLHDGSLRTSPNSELSSKNKSRVIERLMALMIEDDVRADGSILVSRQDASITFCADE